MIFQTWEAGNAHVILFVFSILPQKAYFSYPELRLYIIKPQLSISFYGGDKMSQ